MIRILIGDVRTRLAELPDASVDCCVTSPPYFGLRDYGHEGQIGLEETPQAFIAELVAVFSEVRRVLAEDGTLWVNMGDSYASTGGALAFGSSDGVLGRGVPPSVRRAVPLGIKSKDLIGIPWMLAFALRADGWWLRQDIIWHKPNPMPESITDRCTKAHEYVFLLSKSPRYHFDAAAIAEPVTQSSIARLSQDVETQVGSDRVPGKTNGPMKAVRGAYKAVGTKDAAARETDLMRTRVAGSCGTGDRRNKRSVWTVATQPFAEAHFATFPPALIEPCIKAGCREGGTVLDPFFGAGTTGLVADRLGRHAIGVELNPAYAEIARKRIVGDAPMFVEVRTE